MATRSRRGAPMASLDANQDGGKAAEAPPPKRARGRRAEVEQVADPVEVALRELRAEGAQRARRAGACRLLGYSSAG